MSRVKSIEIRPADTQLNAISMDGLFSATADALANAGAKPRNATLDLGAVEFFDPYAVVSLSVLVEFLAAQIKEEPSILLPRNLNVRSYLRRLRALEKWQKVAILDGDCTSDSGGSQSDVLLELSRIDSKRAIVKATEQLLEIVSANLGYKRKSINAVTNTISELCFNVLDHSEGAGWAVAQRYRRSNGSRFLWIGVADGGVGIKKSLGSRYDTSKWSHFDAIENALKKNFSRFTERGLGLHMVKRIVFDFGGSLHIRTGDYRLYLAARPRGIQGAWFPGTQVGISLSEQSGA
jgi:anti-sigma regulatory factor (Ser/Thr protein kinase)